MKTQRTLWMVGAAMLMSAAPLLAQQPQRITFADAIQIALKQNLTVRQAENTVELNQARTSQLRQNLLPNFQLNVGGNDNIGRQFNTQEGRITTQQTQSVNPSVSSNFLLFDGGRTTANIRSARASTDAANFDLTRTRQTAVFNVASDFVALVSAQSQLDVQKDNLAALKAQLDQIQQFANAGARPISDLYQQRANVAAAQLAVTQADQRVEQAKINLIQALQLDPAKEYEFVAPQIPEVVTTRVFRLDSLVARAYASRPDIIAAQARVTSAMQDTKAAGAGRLPSLNGSLGYGTGYNSVRTDPIGRQFELNRGGGASVSLSFPIFDRGSVRYGQRQASLNQENAELALVNQKQGVALEVRTAWLNVRSAQEQLVASDAQQIAATQALDAVQQRYNVGAATLLEITQARNQLVQAQSALSSAKYNLVLTQAVLSYYTGELDPNNIKLGG